MNAHDSSSPAEPRPLSAPVRASLSDAIASVYRDAAGNDDVLRQALRLAATEARDRGLRPEELIVAIKALLDDVPGGSYGLSAGDQLRIRDRIVSACIKAYFRGE